jgi:hypothetical protein
MSSAPDPNPPAEHGTRITVSESIHVRRPPEAVWEFTQDYERRAQWDASILEATVLVGPPKPRVQVRCAGGVRAVFQYRQFDRPSRTSLAMEVVRSALFEGGGGSWSYAPEGGGTTWTQTNSLILKPGCLRRLLVSMCRAQLRASTRRAMARAKAMLESNAE